MKQQQQQQTTTTTTTTTKINALLCEKKCTGAW
jgi:hypothetical protein